MGPLPYWNASEGMALVGRAPGLKDSECPERGCEWREVAANGERYLDEWVL
jgi:hypothetical protein